jgi:hypothetical protein
MNKTKKYLIISIALIITTVTLFTLPQPILNDFYHMGNNFLFNYHNKLEFETATNIYIASVNAFNIIAIIFAILSVIAVIKTLIYWKIK